MKRQTHQKLVGALIHAAYKSGYYSGKGEDGQPHHMKTIKLSGRLMREVLERLKKGDETADKLRSIIAAERRRQAEAFTF